MPEIWMPYGNVEVVINVKAEQLGEIIDIDNQAIEKESLRSKLAAVSVPDIIVHDQFEYSKKIVHELISTWGEAGKTVKIFSGYDIENAWNDAQSVEVGPVDGSMIRFPSPLIDQSILVVSMGSFHPIYGYYGTIPFIAETIGLREQMIRRWRKTVESGKDTDAFWFAEKVVSNLKKLVSFEYVPSPSGIAHLAYGDASSVRSSIKEFIDNKRQIKAKGSRLVILGCGGLGLDSTLSSALITAGNNMSIIPKDAEIVVVAECGKGLGSQELRAAADNMAPQRSSSEGFILESLRSTANVHLVSILPKSIVERRLGFIAHSSLKEAFESIESKHGWRLKSTILPHASFMMTTRVS
ncbi:MAG: hypothetical protein QXG05_01800 [Nitrososphaerota archaeon]